ncbi:MAG: type II toxin-antitoxin system RelE/ParE family toxin [Spirosoma sp.]|nr:type II toxin-antitoxin system RelE/ParE family toxin [Spirosoma sp.]
MINWKESAREDVLEIYSYFLSVSFALADNWSDELEKKLKLIEQFPGMGRIVPDYDVSFIREVFVSSYRLVYSTQEDVLKVLAVRPMGRPLGKL